MLRVLPCGLKKIRLHKIVKLIFNLSFVFYRKDRGFENIEESMCV